MIFYVVFLTCIRTFSVVLTERVIPPLPLPKETIVEPSSSPFHSIRSTVNSSYLTDAVFPDFYFLLNFILHKTNTDQIATGQSFD